MRAIAAKANKTHEVAVAINDFRAHVFGAFRAGNSAEGTDLR